MKRVFLCPGEPRPSPISAPCGTAAPSGGTSCRQVNPPHKQPGRSCSRNRNVQMLSRNTSFKCLPASFRRWENYTHMFLKTRCEDWVPNSQLDTITIHCGCRIYGFLPSDPSVSSQSWHVSKVNLALQLLQNTRSAYSPPSSQFLQACKI